MQLARLPPPNAAAACGGRGARRQARCKAYSAPPSSQAQRNLKRQLGEALARLPGLAGVLPGGGDAEAKQRVLALVADLERAAPFHPDAPGAAEALLGRWDLVFASDGTVVTRAPPAQALAQLASALPGFGLGAIRQELEDPAAGPGAGAPGAPAAAPEALAGAGVSCFNQVELGLGPLGNWTVRVRGHWLTCHAPGWRFSGGDAPRRRGGSGGNGGGGGGGGADEDAGLSSEVAFDGLGIRFTGLFGLDLGSMLPELMLSVPRRPPRAQANWRTTFCDGEYRVGRGVETGGVFLFRKRA